MSWRVVGSVVCAWVAVLAVLVPRGAPEPEPVHRQGAPVASPAAGARDELAEGLGVLAAWDAERAGAWAAADEQRLLGLYAAGSRAGAADVALLRQWERAGWRVEGLTTQVLGAEVVRATDDRLVLRVVDRVAGGRVVPLAVDGGAGPDAGAGAGPDAASGSGSGAGPGGLPGTAAAVRTVELRQGPAGWQVASVRAVRGSAGG